MGGEHIYMDIYRRVHGRDASALPWNMATQGAWLVVPVGVYIWLCMHMVKKRGKEKRDEKTACS